MKLEMFRQMTSEELKQKLMEIAEEGMTWKNDTSGTPYAVDGLIDIELPKKATIADRDLVGIIEFICTFNKIRYKFSIEK